ncbi:DUF3572 family protein [Sphingomonas sp. ASV193]|uniref:DUF3572 family protein n=1 Tax=Sphingomonas sp. ASV193 TaxID=3144405 RepID=UPI0032E87656
MLSASTNDPRALALAALAATLSEEARAQRFLDLTGLDAATLRARAGDDTTLVALLDFLEAHEPDLVAVARAVGTSPGTLVAARREIEA